MLIPAFLDLGEKRVEIKEIKRGVKRDVKRENMGVRRISRETRTR